MQYTVDVGTRNKILAYIQIIVIQ